MPAQRSTQKRDSHPPATSAASLVLAPPAGAPKTPKRLLDTEYLLTNGLGGYSMGTAGGVPTRRYHGLLIAAEHPPVGRIMALNASADRLVVDAGSGSERAIDLSTFNFDPGAPILAPRGIDRLARFERDRLGTAEWSYRAEVGGAPVEIVRAVHLLHGENDALLRYTVLRSKPGVSDLRLEVRPLASLRDVHTLLHRSADGEFVAEPGGRSVTVRRHDRVLSLSTDAPKARFRPDRDWWHGLYYWMESDRGQDCLEDLFSPGVFELDIPREAVEVSCTIRARFGPPADGGGAIVFEHARAARAGRAARAPAPDLPAEVMSDPKTAALLAAADEFVVARVSRSPGQAGVSIIAGYPWFSDWGRDSLISMRGLLLSMRRFDEARRLLLTFADARRHGLIPNLFDDRTGEPEYNTVDASLWFLQAAADYAEAAGDAAAWREHLRAACLDIIAAYRRGTEFNIAMDPRDKLITAGTIGTQLTWMDARRDGVVFTPRHGKPVEINALWCSGLLRIAESLRRLAEPGDDSGVTAANLHDLGQAAARSFRASFWNPARGCLFDCLRPSESKGTGWTPVDELRPNQIFAVSLPHSPLSRPEQEAVVGIVRERLWTPVGVRTLDPAAPGYIGRYRGRMFDRDAAYHNGTAWPWLLGPLAEAVLRVGEFSPAARAESRALIEPALAGLTGPSPDGPCCPGHIAEIYDGSGDAAHPQRPDGCPAQAWSVAELLRVWVLMHQ